MLTRVLKSEGYEVLHASTGREGLGMLGDRRPDLLLLDLMLPDIDGLEICRLMRCDGFRDLPIIVVSARMASQDQQQAIEAGASACLAKPFHVDQLLDLVRVWLKVSQ
ncbi:MAG: DNA-binding response regulator [Chloroflexi bacterium]|nr:DNA-binding response regulator [Chloroflexota bacterium]